MLDRQMILRELATNADRIRRFGARRLGLFGTYARDEARPDSDLDFVVEFEDGRKSFDAYMDLKSFLEDLFEREVDLVLAEVIKPRLRETILSEAVHAAGL